MLAPADFRAAQIQMEMQGLRLEPTDRRMAQFARYVPRDVEYAQAYNLVGETTGNRVETNRDDLVNGGCRESLCLYRLQIPHLARSRYRMTLNLTSLQIGKQPTLSV